MYPLAISFTLILPRMLFACFKINSIFLQFCNVQSYSGLNLRIQIIIFYITCRLRYYIINFGLVFIGVCGRFRKDEQTVIIEKVTRKNNHRYFPAVTRVVGGALADERVISEVPSRLRMRMSRWWRRWPRIDWSRSETWSDRVRPIGMRSDSINKR